MINKRILLIPALLFLVLIYSCSDSPTSIGGNLLGPDYLTLDSINTYQDSIPQTSTYYKTRIRLSDSPRLLVGKYENIEEASTLMRFRVVLPDTLQEAYLNSNLTIVDAKIELTKQYKIGDVSSPPSFSAYRVNSGWTSYGFNADSLPGLDYDPAAISSNIAETDSLITFNIDEPTINDWFHTASDTAVHDNKGIYLKPDDGANGIFGFGAYNITYLGIPKLSVIIITSGVTDTLIYYSIEDVSAIKGDKPTVPAGVIAVQTGLAVNSRVRFDLSSIPKGSVINKAQLTVFIDSSATHHGDSYTNSLTAYFAKDTSDNSYDTTSAVVLSRMDNYFTGDLVRFIQSISSGYHDNNGIVLAAGGQNLGVDIFGLKGSDAADPALRPRLVITYTGRK